MQTSKWIYLFSKQMQNDKRRLRYKFLSFCLLGLFVNPPIVDCDIIIHDPEPWVVVEFSDIHHIVPEAIWKNKF